MALNLCRDENQILAIDHSGYNHFPTLPAKNGSGGNKEHEPLYVTHFCKDIYRKKDQKAPREKTKPPCASATNPSYAAIALCFFQPTSKEC
jgi:hypothetical protein